MKLRKIKFGKWVLLAVLLPLVVGGVVAGATSFGRAGDTHSENHTPLPEVLDPETAGVMFSMDNAIQNVKMVWSVPDVNVKGTLIRNSITGETFWFLDWRIGSDAILAATVDADTGEIISISDFRFEGRKDELKSTAVAVEIGLELLRKKGITIDGLSEPKVTIVTTPMGSWDRITYQVLWHQVEGGTPVPEGYVLVDIDAETGEVVGFGRRHIDVEGADMEASVPMSEAIKTAKEFIQEYVKENWGPAGRTKDHEVIVLDVELVIQRPNYTFWEYRLGEPTLVWEVFIETRCKGINLVTGEESDERYWFLVWVDAYTREIVGGKHSS